MIDDATVVAIDCGGTNLSVAISPSPDSLEHLTTLPTPDDLTDLPGVVIAHLREMDRPISAIGMGVAGLVDHRTGTLAWMPHAAGANVPIAAEIRDSLGIAVVIDNDANLATLAEARSGAGHGSRMVLGVMLGTGIGSGLVIDGSIERGAGFLGEVGHIAIDPGGEPCPCGQVGCWETVVSGRALDAAARRVALADTGRNWPAIPTGRDLVEAARAGHEGACTAVHRIGEAFGAGLATLVLTLDPDVIVVGGGPSAAGDLLLDSARSELSARIPGPGHRSAPPVRVARFGSDAGLVGAAIIAREEAV